MKLSYAHPEFFCVATYDERTIPKAAGCRWNSDKKRWWTRDLKVARKLLAYADDHARLTLDAALLKHDATVIASRAVDTTLDIPCPEGLAYYDFQKAGVAFLAEHPACLLGDAMGVGKTIQACGLLNLKADIKRVLIVCPASLRLNWQRELERWIVPTRDMHVLLATTKQTLADLVTFL